MHALTVFPARKPAGAVVAFLAGPSADFFMGAPFHADHGLWAE